MKILYEHPNLGCFLISYFLVLFLTPYVILLANKFKVMDIPSHRKIHTEPVARWGGIAVAIAFFVAVISTLEYSKPLIAVLCCASVVMIVGAIDDVKNIPAIFKLAVLFACSLYLAKAGIKITVFSVPTLISIILVLVWFSYLASCFNAIDNMNGLSAGIGGISSLMFYFISGQTGQFYMGYIAIALCAACFAFLRFNFWRASIFLGDSGSFFIGFVLASIAIMGNWGTHKEPLKGIIVPVLILWFPLYDLFVTTLLRVVNGKVKNPLQAISFSAKDHISHRLQKKFNLSQTTTVLILYLISFILGYLGIISRLVDIKFSILIFISVIIFSIYFSFVLNKAEIEY